MGHSLRSGRGGQSLGGRRQGYDRGEGGQKGLGNHVDFLGWVCVLVI
jgi:hypothetical protein